MKNYIINKTKAIRRPPQKADGVTKDRKRQNLSFFALMHSPTQANEEGWLIDILDYDLEYEWNFFIERIQVIKQIDETPLNFILDI